MSRTLRLDPSLPLVWRTPDSFQVGVNPAIAIIDSLDSRFLPVLSALSTGISEEGCEAIASHEGITPENTRTFLSALGEVLLHKNPEPLPRVAITGSTGNHRVFSQVWAQLGHTLVALASQLTAHTAATDTPAFHALAAWHARELVETDTPGLTLRIDRYTRRTTSHVEEVSARCACRSLED
ncbi:MAG: hypothetical protein HOJ98_05505 [Microbacteriaceae bacterium]|nr:hypothetical protein [Microbacteriaceae bacterium]